MASRWRARRWVRAGFSAFGLRTLALLSIAAAGVGIAIHTGDDADAALRARALKVSELTRNDHGSQVWSLAFSHDGFSLASATIGGDVVIQSLLDGHQVHLRRGALGSVRSVAFAGGSRVLAFAGEGPRVEFWDAGGGSELPALDVGGAPSSWIAFSPDGALLAAGGGLSSAGRGRVAVWDWRKRRLLADLDLERGGARGLAFSPDGSRLAVGDSWGDVSVYSVADWSLKFRRESHEPGQGGVSSLVFGPDGRLIATAGGIDATVRIWDGQTGEPAGTLKQPAYANALAFSPDSRLIAVALGNGTVALWDLASRQPAGTVATGGPTLYSVGFSSDGGVMATGNSDGVVSLWNLSEALKVAAGSEPSPGKRP
jgi:WD40 repeat protein